MEMIKTQKLEQHYVVSSNKIYGIGAQDGSFPELGFHVEGQMGGIISQPVKLLDGYEASILYQGERIALLKADEFHVREHEVEFVYYIKEVVIRRKEVCYLNMRVMEVSWEIESQEVLDLEIVYRSHVVGCWTKEMVGRDCDKTVLHQKWADGAILKNQEYPWFLGIFLRNDSKAYVIEETQGNPLVQFFMREVVGKIEYTFYLIGSIESSVDIMGLYQQVVGKKEYYHGLKDAQVLEIKNQCGIESNLPVFDQAFEYLKLNYQSLVQDIAGIGEGYTAGYPDYPWFFGCDACFGVKGAVATGQYQMSMQTLRLLKNISMKANGNGRIIHELSPFDVVYNEGNPVETPQFISAVYEVFCWTKDNAFLEEMYPVCQSGILWLRKTCLEEETGLPIGSGMVEVEGLNTRMIDTAVYTYCGYRDLARMATYLQREEAKLYEGWAVQLKEDIMTYFYMPEEHLFADALCTKQELKQRKEEIVYATKNTPSQVRYLEGYLEGLLATADDQKLIQVLVKNWVIILPLLEDILPKDEAEKMIIVLLQGGFLNEYGMMLSGMPFDENEHNEDIYAMNLAMSINTGCLAKACIRYGFVEEGFSLLMNMCNTLSRGMPGTIAEVLPEQGCFMQLWSGYGIHHVFLEEVLGIKVGAFHDTLTITPNFPKALTDVKLKNVKIGGKEFDFVFRRDGVGNIQSGLDCH